MDPTTNPVPQKLTVEQIALSSEYRRLTPRMQKWAAVYIQGFLDTGGWEPVKATLAAFTSANLNVARVTSWRVKRHPQMKAVLDIFMNSSKTPLELALEDLKRELNEIDRHLAATDAGSVAGQRLISTRRKTRQEIDGLAEQIAKAASEPLDVAASAPAPTAPHRFKVGETCIVNGKAYTVTKVDENGNALAGEPQ